MASCLSSMDSYWKFLLGYGLPYLPIPLASCKHIDTNVFLTSDALSIAADRVDIRGLRTKSCVSFRHFQTHVNAKTLSRANNNRIPLNVCTRYISMNRSTQCTFSLRVNGDWPIHKDGRSAVLPSAGNSRRSRSNNVS